MSVHNVELIRGYVLRKMKDLKIYVSCLEPTEMDALRAMDGVKGQQLAAQIADFVLDKLGHHAPQIGTNGDSPTMRQARHVIGKGTKDAKGEREA